MIDMHSHILPGLDDGAVDVAESIQMCRIAADDGIRVIVATPHSLNGLFTSDPPVVKQLVVQLTGLARSQGIDIRILPGMEIRIVADLLEKLEDGSVLTLAQGRYILLELPAFQVPAGFESLIEKLLHRDYGIVLAHPEKNVQFQDNPALLFNYSRKFPPWGIILQLSADSILGDAGRVPQRFSKWIMKNSLPTIISTDSHSEAIRPPRLNQALKQAAAWVGSSRAKLMVREIPAAIIAGSGFPNQDQPLKRPWWKII